MCSMMRSRASTAMRSTWERDCSISGCFFSSCFKRIRCGHFIARGTANIDFIYSSSTASKVRKSARKTKRYPDQGQLHEEIHDRTVLETRPDILHKPSPSAGFWLVINPSLTQSGLGFVGIFRSDQPHYQKREKGRFRENKMKWNGTNSKLPPGVTPDFPRKEEEKKEEGIGGNKKKGPIRQVIWILRSTDGAAYVISLAFLNFYFFAPDWASTTAPGIDERAYSVLSVSSCLLCRFCTPMISAYPRFHCLIATSATWETIMDIHEPRIKITEAEGQPPLIQYCTVHQLGNA